MLTKLTFAKLSDWHNQITLSCHTDKIIYRKAVILTQLNTAQLSYWHKHISLSCRNDTTIFRSALIQTITHRRAVIQHDISHTFHTDTMTSLSSQTDTISYRKAFTLTQSHIVQLTYWHKHISLSCDTTKIHVAQMSYWPKQTSVYFHPTPLPLAVVKMTESLISLLQPSLNYTSYFSTYYKSVSPTATLIQATGF
jgi:hypothetical protein